MDTLTTEKKRILFIAANPEGTKVLDLKGEFQEIIDALERSKSIEKFEIEIIDEAQPEDFQTGLVVFKPNIVHFAGHGEKKGPIVIGENSLHIIDRKVLSELFALCSEHIECAIFNACDSSPTAEIIGKYINYVIGMNETIKDKSAISFSSGFYEALGAGYTVQEAYKLGKVAIGMKGQNKGYKTPRLIEGKKKFLKTPPRSNGKPIMLAISSHIHYSHKEMIEKADRLLPLYQYFNDRKLQKGSWEDLKFKIKQFLSRMIKLENEYHLFLPLHSSLAFFTGSVLNFKCSAKISVFQTTGELNLLPLHPKEDSKNTNTWNTDKIKTLQNGNDLAIALSINNPIINDVKDYIDDRQLSIPHIIHLFLDKISQDAIQDAAHSFKLATIAKNIIDENYKGKGIERLHLFLAAPNIFTLMLAQQIWTIPNVLVYEHDPKAKDANKYIPAVTI